MKIGWAHDYDALREENSLSLLQQYSPGTLFKPCMGLASAEEGAEGLQMQPDLAPYKWSYSELNAGGERERRRGIVCSTAGKT